MGLGDYKSKARFSVPNLKGAKNIQELASLVENALQSFAYKQHGEQRNLERTGRSSGAGTFVTNLTVGAGGGGSSGSAATIHIRHGEYIVTVAGNVTIPFDEDMPDGVYHLDHKAYKADGTQIAPPKFISQDMHSFTIYVPVLCTIKYSAVKSIL